MKGVPDTYNESLPSAMDTLFFPVLLLLYIAVSACFMRHLIMSASFILSETFLRSEAMPMLAVTLTLVVFLFAISLRRRKMVFST